MNTSVLRIMVINWRWTNRLGYPSYPQEGSSLHEVLKIVPQLDVIGENQVKLQDDRLPQYDHSMVNAYVFTPKVELLNEADKIRTRDFRIQYVNAFRERIPDTQAQFLFLLHSTDTYPIGLTEDFEAIKHSMNGNWEAIKFGSFGGGTGTIYDNAGLLNHSIPTFSKPGKAAWFMPTNKIKALAIKQKNFEYVWAHYWYQTQQKINRLRELIERIHFPTKNLKIQETAYSSTQNFLFHLGLKQYQIRNSSFETLDFSECKDLHIWVSQEFLGDRLSVLQEVAEGKAGDAQAISQYFDDLIRSWRKKR